MIQLLSFFLLILPLIAVADDNNTVTLKSYEESVDEYVCGTPLEVTGDFKTWIDQTLNHISKEAKIIEIGSAFGRDASYIEMQGFKVERTDAAEGFVKLLQKKGYQAKLFNILTDEFNTTYDLVFANAVFLHFNPEELQQVLKKIHAALSGKGILSFSVKKGEGEEWSTAKVGKPRYFYYWQKESIKAVLDTVGFNILDVYEDQKFLQIIVNKNQGESCLYR